MLINNFGTLGLILFVILFCYFLYFLIYQFRQYRCCRRLGKRAAGVLFWSILLRMIIESYIIGMICCLCNLQSLDFSEGDAWTVANSVITLILSPVIFVFPFAAAISMFKHFKELKLKPVRRKYGELYEGFSTKKP